MGLTDYSDLEKELNNAPQPTLLPKGAEVKARIIAVRSGVSEKNGARWYSPVFDVPDQPMVVEFNTFFWDLLEKSKIDPKQYARNLYQMQQFFKAFKIDISKPFDWETDLVGKTGYLQVGVQHDDQYGDKNSVSKYVAGASGASAKASGNAPLDDNDIPF